MKHPSWLAWDPLGPPVTPLRQLATLLRLWNSPRILWDPSESTAVLLRPLRNPWGPLNASKTSRNFPETWYRLKLSGTSLSHSWDLLIPPGMALDAQKRPYDLLVPFWVPLKRPSCILCRAFWHVWFIILDVLDFRMAQRSCREVIWVPSIKFQPFRRCASIAFLMQDFIHVLEAVHVHSLCKAVEFF